MPIDWDEIARGGFVDFAGLTITGSIPVAEEALNDLLVHVLRQARNGGGSGSKDRPAAPPVAAAAPPSPSGPGPDLAAAMLGLVKRAQITADNGKLTLDFDLRVDGPDASPGPAAAAAPAGEGTSGLPA